MLVRKIKSPSALKRYIKLYYENDIRYINKELLKRFNISIFYRYTFFIDGVRYNNKDVVIVKDGNETIIVFILEVKNFNVLKVIATILKDLFNKRIWLFNLPFIRKQVNTPMISEVTLEYGETESPHVLIFKDKVAILHWWIRDDIDLIVNKSWFNEIEHFENDTVPFQDSLYFKYISGLCKVFTLHDEYGEMIYRIVLIGKDKKHIKELENMLIKVNRKFKLYK